MIYKSFEFNKIDIKKHNFYLFYGENNGLKKELIETVFKKKFKENIYNYDESQILQNEKRFFDEILTKSFFENEKFIIISGATVKIIDIINELIEQKVNDTYIVLLSDKLEKKSKLRYLFEKEKNLVCVPFYADNFQSLSFIANEFFKKINIPVSQEIINLLINRANGDRQNLKNEINKIEGFLVDKKNITLENILKLTNMTEINNYSELVDNCLAKNEKKIINILNENNFTNEDSIIIIRVLLAKAKRLFNIKKAMKSNKNLDEVLA